MAADQHSGPTCYGITHVSLDFLYGTRVDHRADLRVFTARRAHTQRTDPTRQRSSETLVDEVLNIHPVRTHAGLPAVAELGSQEPVNGRFEIGILEYDEGSIAAKLEGQFLQCFRRPARELFANPSRAGEGDFAHPAVQHPHVRSLRGVATRCRHDIHDAAG